MRYTKNKFNKSEIFYKGMFATGIGLCLFAAPFAIGKWSNKVEKVVGTEYQDIKREQFESSKSYVHGKIEDLQRYKRELERTTDKDERLALINHIQDEFAAFDIRKIDNFNLRLFIEKIMSGEIE